MRPGTPDGRPVKIFHTRLWGNLANVGIVGLINRHQAAMSRDTLFKLRSHVAHRMVARRAGAQKNAQNSD